MSVAAFETGNAAVTVTDLFAYDQGQVVQYLKRHYNGEIYDVSDLIGVESLSGRQRDELAQRFK